MSAPAERELALTYVQVEIWRSPYFSLSTVLLRYRFVLRAKPHSPACLCASLGAAAAAGRCSEAAAAASHCRVTAVL